MKIFLGLGNPGPIYAETRHNVGIMLVDRMFKYLFMMYPESYGWRRKKDVIVAEFPDLVLVKTAGVFMNESGRMIHDLRFMNYDFENLYVAHDDLDIGLGDFKIQMGKGPKAHNGLISIEGVMRTDQFWRIRIGVDNRQTPQTGEEYVLQRFSPEEVEIVTKVVDEVAKKVVYGQ